MWLIAFFSYIFGRTDSFITKYIDLKVAAVILDMKSSIRRSLGLQSPGHMRFCWNAQVFVSFAKERERKRSVCVCVCACTCARTEGPDALPYTFSVIIAGHRIVQTIRTICTAGVG